MTYETDVQLKESKRVGVCIKLYKAKAAPVELVFILRTLMEPIYDLIFPYSREFVSES